MFKFSHEQCSQILEKNGFSIRCVESNRQIHSNYLEKRYRHSYFYVLRIISVDEPVCYRSKLYKGYQRCYHSAKSFICDFLSNHPSSVFFFEFSIYDKCVSLNKSEDVFLHRFRSRVLSSFSYIFTKKYSFLNDFENSSELQSYLDKVF